MSSCDFCHTSIDFVGDTCPMCALNVELARRDALIQHYQEMAAGGQAPSGAPAAHWETVVRDKRNFVRLENRIAALEESLLGKDADSLSDSLEQRLVAIEQAIEDIRGKTRRELDSVRGAVNTLAFRAEGGSKGSDDEFQVALDVVRLLKERLNRR